MYFEWIFCPCMILWHHALVIWRILVHWVIQVLQILTHFIIKYFFKSHLLTSPPISLENSLGWGSCQAHSSRHKFFKNLIKDKKSVLYLWQQKLAVLEITGSLCSFLRKYIANGRITIVCQSFQVNMVFHDNWSFFSPQSSFSSKYDQSYFGLQHTSHFFLLTTKKMDAQDSRFNNFNNFHFYYIKDTLKRKLFYWVHSSDN